MAEKPITLKPAKRHSGGVAKLLKVGVMPRNAANDARASGGPDWVIDASARFLAARAHAAAHALTESERKASRLRVLRWIEGMPEQERRAFGAVIEKFGCRVSDLCEYIAGEAGQP